MANTGRGADDRGNGGRRHRAALALALAIGAATAALARPGTSDVPAEPSDRAIIHVLNRLAFGPRPGDVDRVRQMGIQKYIDRQLHPEWIPDAAMAQRLSGFVTLQMSSRDLAERYFLPVLEERRAQRQQQARETAAAGAPETPDPPQRAPRQLSDAQRDARLVLDDLTQQKVLRAVYSERQLEEVMVDFWFNHFNVFAGKGLTRQYLTAYEQQTIRPHALGRFRDLLGATAESPAMLFYLDNWMSADPEAAKRLAAGRPRQMRGAQVPPNAQPRRPTGLNENFARELMELHTLGVDGGYTQQDVVEVARAFSGWTIANPRAGGSFVFDPRRHAQGKKLVLGREISAGGKKDGEAVLDILARHPSTARFIATKLVRRFVADDPPASLVERAGTRFRETDGDIREVVRVIVTSREFFAADAYRAKVKTPFEFVVSALRVTDARMDHARAVVQNLRALGMPPYSAHPPTGYDDTADAWVNTGALVARMNFAVQLAANRLRGISVAAPEGEGGEDAPLADLAVSRLLGGDVSDATRQTLERAEAPAQAAALALGSPEFQKR